MRKEMSSIENINVIHEHIVRLGRLISAQRDDLPTVGHSIDFAHPHIEIQDDEYNYVMTERGVDIVRKKTRNVGELLMWVFEHVAFSIAVRDMRTIVTDSIDQRRFIFSRQLELLNRLNAKWADVVRQKQSEQLRRSPFDDSSLARAKYCGELRERGLSDSEAWKSACEKYPLPQHTEPHSGGD